MRLCTLLSVVVLVSAPAQAGDGPVLFPDAPWVGEIPDSAPVVTSERLSDALATPAVGLAFPLQIDASGTYHIELRSDDFDAYLIVRDRSGHVLAEDDDGLLVSDAQVVLRLEAGGGTQVVACALHGRRGAFELTLKAGEPPRRDAAERRTMDIIDGRRRLAAREAAEGPDGLGVADACTTLALCLARTGDHAGMRPLFERALAIRERALGSGHAAVASSLADLANLLFTLGDLPGAQRLHERVVALRESLPGDDQLALQSLSWVALLRHQQGDTSGAIALQERAAAGLERLLGPEHPALADGLYQLGLMRQALGTLGEARSLHERALAIRRQALGDAHPKVAASQSALTGLLLAQGDYDAAIPLAREALEHMEAAVGPEHPDVAAFAGNLAVLYEKIGDYGRARSLNERSLAIRTRHLGAGHHLIAVSQHNLSADLYQLGDLAGARSLSESALDTAEAALGPDHPLVGAILDTLGRYCMAGGDLSTARRHLERAVSLRERADGAAPPDLAASLEGLSQVLEAQHDLAGARRHAERALEVRTTALGAEHVEVAFSLANLASVVESAGDLEGSRVLYERASALFAAGLGPSHPISARCRVNQAVVTAALGDAEAARTLAEQALAQLEARLGPDHADLMAALGLLAELSAQGGDLAAAEALAARAVDISANGLGPDHPTTAVAQGKLAAVLHQKDDIEGARTLLEQSVASLEAAFGPAHRNTLVSRNNLAMVLLDLGLFDEAARQLQLGAASGEAVLSEFMRQASAADALAFLDRLRWTLELRLSSALATTAPVAAYELLLAWKGRALRAARASRSGLRKRLGADGERLALRMQGVVSELSRLASGSPASVEGRVPDGFRQLAEQRGRLERELAAASAAVLPAVPTWTEVRDALPPDSALVDLFAHRSYEPGTPGASVPRGGGSWQDTHMTAWITRRGAEQPVRVDLGPRAAIEAALRAPGSPVALARGGRLAVAPADAPAPDSRLRHLVWDVLAPHLEGITLVFISPDDVLAALPFEILRLDDGRYLIEERGFISLTDPTSLVTQRQRRAVQSGSLLAVGGVDYGPGDDLLPADAATTADGRPRTGRWSPLPATEAEARSVVDQHALAFPQAPRLLLVGSDANEARLKAELPQCALVHLATHGDVELGQRPEASPHGAAFGEPLASVERPLEDEHPGLLARLVCAGANTPSTSSGEDGYLTAEEVGWLDLAGVDLVVLSACDTGLGRPQSGEGLLGLRRAFLLAGAGTVISSLWSVPDQETAELMQLFYANRWQRHLDGSEALRAAQLELIRRNRERFGGDAAPATWGAFVLDGDWR